MNNEEILDVVREAYDYSEKLYSGMNKLINDIDNRTLEDLDTYFKNILEGFNWILEVIILSKINDNNSVDLNGVQGKVKKYIEGYNNIDILLVRDVVEYELMPQVEEFYDIFNKYLSNL